MGETALTRSQRLRHGVQFHHEVTGEQSSQWASSFSLGKSVRCSLQEVQMNDGEMGNPETGAPSNILCSQRGAWYDL